MPEAIRVLIVEDNSADAELVVWELRRAGFEPDWTRVESEENYTAELHAKVDVVLSDYEMPQFSGPRALELLKASGLEIPFIIISGAIGEETAVLMMKLGAADYLLKDRLARLGQAVRQALDQSRLRKERQLAATALRESEERFRQLAENIQEAFWMRDPTKNRLLYISPAFEKIWDRSCFDLYTDPGIWTESIHPADAEHVVKAMETRQIDGTYDEEYRIVRPDGTLRWIHDRAFPVRSADGQVRRIVGAAGDITERKELEEQFRQSQKMETVGQLAGGVAHDFNNILTIIQGQASILHTDAAVSGSAHESAAQIIQAASRAASLTRQLLAFSRKQFLRLRSVDLNDVVSDTARMLGRTLGPSVALEVAPTLDLPLILADQAMMEQILLNLAVNARDAMPNGGRLTVSTAVFNSASTDVSGAQSAPGVGLRVTDTGVGIPPEVLPRIFEPFFTTKEASKGTGLGLATVHGIVRQHRGTIRLSSEVGVGTTFEIVFPVAEAIAPIIEEGAPESSSTGGDETILLVEDEPAVRGLVVMILKQVGYNVIEAGSGKQALAVFAEHADSIDLLLTDMAMPDGMTGKSLADELRSRVPRLRVMFTSGYGADVLSENLSPEEVCHFLPKPFGPEELTTAVRDCLNAGSPVAV